MLISYVGREVLIRSIVSSIHVHFISCFKIAKEWCEEVNTMVGCFWWGQREEERRIHWVKWSTLTESKGAGGLGFKDMHDFNLAFLDKMA